MGAEPIRNFLSACVLKGYNRGAPREGKRRRRYALPGALHNLWFPVDQGWMLIVIRFRPQVRS